MNNKYIKFQVSAHHSNECFESYTFRVLNTNKEKEVIAKAIMKLIAKEGKESGWFYPDSPFYRQRKEIEKKVVEMVQDGVPQVIINDLNNKEHQLRVWCHLDSKDNEKLDMGFNIVNEGYEDKWDIRWLSQIS